MYMSYLSIELQLIMILKKENCIDSYRIHAVTSWENIQDSTRGFTKLHMYGYPSHAHSGPQHHTLSKIENCN